MIRWHMHDQPRLVVAVLIWNQFQPPRVRACYKPTLTTAVAPRGRGAQLHDEVEVGRAQTIGCILTIARPYSLSETSTLGKLAVPMPSILVRSIFLAVTSPEIAAAANSAF